MRNPLRTRFALNLIVALVLAWLPQLGQMPHRPDVPAKRIATDKPSKGLNVTLVPQAEVASLGVTSSATLTMESSRDVASFVVSVTAIGSATLNGSATFTVPAAQGGAKTAATIRYLVANAGKGEIRAAVTAQNNTGKQIATRVVQLYYLASADEVLFGRSGPLDLQLKRYGKDRQAGRLDADAYEAAIAQSLYGGATETRAPLAGAGAVGADAAAVTPQAAADITVSGQILWTDSAGGTHPVRLAPVEIWDAEVFGDELVATVNTDAAGNYTATVNNDDGTLRGGRDIYIRVLGQGPGFTIKQPGFFGSSIPGIQSSTDDDVADGAAVAKSLTANNTDDNNTAFSVHDAMVTAIQYIERTRGSRYPDVEVIFPTDRGGSFYDPEAKVYHLLRGDRFDWDVIHHEYGHFVADQLDVDDNPGGDHSPGSLSDTYGYTKDISVRLAWGEAWPTYFALSLQQVQRTAAWGIPNVGDTRYQDTDDASIDYDLESQAGSPSDGEDDEVAASRTIWDVFDAADDPGDTGISLGDAAVWNTLDAANPRNLSDAYQALTAGKPMRELAQMSCIFTEHNVAPQLTTPADRSRAPKAPPTFRWDANGGGSKYRNNKFIVEFYDHSFGTQLFATPEQDATSFTPTQAQWDDIVKRAGPIINWVVKGRQTDAPATGTYTSCASRLVPPKLDLVFVIDTTGSMWDDLASVKASASTIIDTIAASGADYRIALVDFKDHPVSPYGQAGDYPSRLDLNFSTDKAATISAINALSAGGGGDWPESVFSGLMQAINLSWRADASKAIILMGDAPPHDPEPVTGYTQASVTAAANKAGIGVSPSAAASAEMSSTAVAPTAVGDGARIYPILIGYDYSAFVAFQSLADGTGGELFEASSASNVVAAILRAIDAILTAPVADAGGPYTGQAGRPVFFDGSGSSDVDGTITSYAWDFESDGIFDVETTTPTVTHTYPGVFAGTVTLRVTDNDGRTSTDSADVEVFATTGDLVLGAITTSLEPVVATTTNYASATFTDPTGAGPYTALWTWGDGSSSAGTVSATSGLVEGRHSYSTPGVYEIRLTVTNRAGVSATSVFRYLVVFDPTAGFVTGGGWITSPAGAYVANPAMTGKANFGFVAKYQRGANVPSGHTEFQFKAGNMSFTSTSYDWLVVAGAKAQYKGVGTINGAGRYQFMLTAIDGAVNGDRPDAFRIKIWDADRGTLVYDNQIGADDTVDPTTVLGGGSIVIHKQGGQ